MSIPIIEASNEQLDAVANKYNLHERPTAYEVMCLIYTLDHELEEERAKTLRSRERLAQAGRLALVDLKLEGPLYKESE